MVNIVRINGKAAKSLAATANIAIINAEIGNFANLNTTAKNNFVAVINEAAQSDRGCSIGYLDNPLVFVPNASGVSF